MNITWYQFASLLGENDICLVNLLFIQSSGSFLKEKIKNINKTWKDDVFVVIVTNHCFLFCFFFIYQKKNICPNNILSIY